MNSFFFLKNPVADNFPHSKTVLPLPRFMCCQEFLLTVKSNKGVKIRWFKFIKISARKLRRYFYIKNLNQHKINFYFTFFADLKRILYQHKIEHKKYF